MKKTKNKEQFKTDNPYKSARLRAARENPELGTAERAAELLMIRREKYLQIEQDDPERKTAPPSADEVRRMIQLYWAPELRSHYCAETCPLGEECPTTCADSLDRIAVRLMVALRRMEQARDELDSILVDGLVAEAEAEEFRRIIRTLKDVAAQADALEVWAQRQKIMALPKL